MSARTRAARVPAAGPFRKAGPTARGSLLILCLAASVAAPPARAMNDTDAVVAMGLFPFDAGSRFLRIEAESLDVLVRPGGCRVRRVYRIACRDTSGTFRLGTAVLGPDYRSDGLERALHVHLDGLPCSLAVRTGRLVDRGASVKVEARTDEEIRDCNEHNDGDICGHTWIEFKADFERGGTRTISLDYAPAAQTPWHALEYAIPQLALYTEKFWAGEAVPAVDVRLRPAGWSAPFEAFIPHGPYLKYTKPGFRTDGGMLHWEIHDYRPDKGPMTYGERLVHPWSINAKSILRDQGVDMVEPSR